MSGKLVRDVVITVREFLSPAAFFYGDGKATSLPNTSNLACFAYRQNRRRTVDIFKSVEYNYSVRPSSLPMNEMSAGVQQINNAVQEVNDLARKNKDSIEGLASEVRKFKV